MSDDSTPRRTFLGQLALTTVGLSSANRAVAAVEPRSRAGLTPVGSTWDDSWTGRLGSHHRFVFDLAEEGKASMVLGQVGTLYDDYGAALDTKDSDMHMVLVIRHGAINLALDDQLWTRYKIGTANPSKESLVSLRARGLTILACNVALMNHVRQFATASSQDEKAVEQDVRSNLLPGVIPQVNGVYAVHRAQDAGCTLYHL